MLTNIGKIETNQDLNIKDAKYRGFASISIPPDLDTHKTYHGSADNRIRMWFAAGTLRDSPTQAHATIGEAAREHDIGLTMYCAEAPRDSTIFRYYY